MKSNLINRYILKDNNDINSVDAKRRVGYVASIFGLSFNIILVIFKVSIGVIFKQSVFIADGLNNLTDILSCLVAFVGFYLSSKPADKEHPYGHQKIEYISSMIISFIIIMLGVVTCYTSIASIVKFFQTENFNFFGTTYTKLEIILIPITLVFSILAKLGAFLIYRHYSKLINSLSLKATSADTRNDMILSAGILISYIIAIPTKMDLNDYMSILISGFIIFSGVSFAIESANNLIGVPPTKEAVSNCVRLIKSNTKVLGFHDLSLYMIGGNSYVGTIHIEVDSSLDLIEAHTILDEIEEEFRTKFNYQITTHLDPVIIGDPLLDRDKLLVTETLAKVDKSISMHDFRVVRTSNDVKFIFDCDISFDNKLLSKEEKKKYKKLGFYKYLEQYRLNMKDRITKEFRTQNPDYGAFEFSIVFENSFNVYSEE